MLGNHTVSDKLSTGKLWTDDPNQQLRALDFAVERPGNKIYAADGQDFGYPLYSLDLAKKRLIVISHAKKSLYSSISFNPNNRLLYGVLWPGPHRDLLATIDPATGECQEIAPIVTGAQISFAPNGVLYAVISGGFLDPRVENGQLYRIDPETAKHTLIGHPELDYKSSHFTISRSGVGYLLEHTGKLRSLNLETGESKLLGDSGCRAAFGLFEYEIPENFSSIPLGEK